MLLQVHWVMPLVHTHRRIVRYHWDSDSVDPRVCVPSCRTQPLPTFVSLDKRLDDCVAHFGTDATSFIRDSLMAHKPRKTWAILSVHNTSEQLEEHGPEETTKRSGNGARPLRFKERILTQILDIGSVTRVELL
eukprot:gb/GECG01001632.1/.p1 GENE.gb/GECG01001632.1/~~gb/GECG01001632.1/.p1  ORF type:complete len:134 (+),score=4.04 gb/GECG01001632.1/:1-402(+)